MEEKRSFPRVGLKAIVTYKVKGARLKGSTRVIDISETGLLIPSNTFFPVGTLLDIEISSNDLVEIITTSARVERIERRKGGKYLFDLGLGLFDMPEDKRKTLSDCIKLVQSRGDSTDVSWLD